MKKLLFKLAFILLKLRTGVSFALIKSICWLFQVVLIANYVKELNMVQLELIPRSIDKMRKSQMNDLSGQGDPIQ